MAFQLMELPIPKSGIPGFLSAETIEYHYGKHHLNYVNKTNELLQGSGFENASLEEIIMKAQGPLFNNAAQIWNHDFYWKTLSPKPQSPGPKTQQLILAQWGQMEAFRKEFETKAVSLFGSGWTWLVFDKTANRLSIMPTSNADNPMRLGLVPLLTVDVWEHAYYIDYRNNRAQYVNVWWNHINWDFVESLVGQL